VFVKTLKLLFALGLIAAILYVGIQLIPPYFANYRFQDALENEALMDSYSTKTEDDIRRIVFKKAQDFDIPIQEDQIQVQRLANNGLAIWVDYSVHVDLPAYPLDLQFHPASKNKPPM
jgi:hypothetical protein